MADIFQAIADPTRREIIQMVARKSLNMDAVAENFPVSRTAVYKHIKVLTECGLITISQKGRERYCEAKLEKLDKISSWIKQSQEMWMSRFDNLDNYLVELKNKKNAKRK